MQRVDYVILGAVALILVVGSLLFLPSGPSDFTLNSAYDEGCKKLTETYACDNAKITSIVSLSYGQTVYTFGNVCATKGFTDTLSCARSCGCVAVGKGAQLSSVPTIAYSDNPVGVQVVYDGEDIEETENVVEYYGI